MLRLIDRASRSLAFGRTENCSRTAGQAAPTRMLESTSRASAITGIWRLRRTTAAKNAPAQITAIMSRISFAGIAALRSV